MGYELYYLGKNDPNKHEHISFSDQINLEFGTKMV